MKKLYYLLLATPLLLNLHCDKDPEAPEAQDLCEIYGTEDQRCREQELAKLPPYTETGEGTFGCLVNGKAFIPSTCCGDLFNPPPPKQNSYYYEEHQAYFIGAMNRLDKTTPYYELGLSFFSNLSTEIPYNKQLQRFSFEERKDGASAIFFSNYPKITFETFNPKSGFITVTHLDTIDQIISGVFEYTAVFESDTISITDGRFDMPYSFQ